MKKTSKGLKLIKITATMILAGVVLLYATKWLGDFRNAGYIGIEFPANQAITSGRIFVAKATEFICGIAGGGLVFNAVVFFFGNIRHLKKVR